MHFNTPDSARSETIKKLQNSNGVYYTIMLLGNLLYKE